MASLESQSSNVCLFACEFVCRTKVELSFCSAKRAYFPWLLLKVGGFLKVSKSAFPSTADTRPALSKLSTACLLHSLIRLLCIRHFNSTQPARPTVSNGKTLRGTLNFNLHSIRTLAATRWNSEHTEKCFTNEEDWPKRRQDWEEAQMAPQLVCLCLLFLSNPEGSKVTISAVYYFGC